MVRMYIYVDELIVFKSLNVRALKDTLYKFLI